MHCFRLPVIILAFLLFLHGIYGEAISQTDENSAIAAIEQLITTFDVQNSRIPNPAAKLVRLAFHDCVEGCDGCLNFGNIDNNGLMAVYRELNTIYNNTYNSTGMSRADFIALAGTIAIRQASKEQDCQQLRLPPNCVLPMPSITIKYGRRDCTTSPSTNRNVEFPNPHGDLTHVLDFFRIQMNMTTRETVAISGAHSLGSAGFQRSGFNGPWSPPTNRFDNAFYRTLSTGNNNWFQQELNNSQSPVFPQPRYQWTFDRNNNQQNRLMLNSDMALFKRIQPDSTGRETDATCRNNFNSCQSSTTAGIVNEFANDNTAFHEAFGPAFQKMIETGYLSEELVTAGVDLPGTTNPTATPSNPTNSVTDDGNINKPFFYSMFCAIILAVTWNFI